MTKRNASDLVEISVCAYVSAQIVLSLDRMLEMDGFIGAAGQMSN